MLASYHACWFVLGPFEAEWKNAAGGLLATATAVAMGGQVLPSTESGALVELRIRIVGSFARPDGAKERFLAWYNQTANDSLGRLCGLHEQLDRVVVRANADSIEGTIRLDANRLIHGLRASIDAPISEVMRW